MLPFSIHLDRCMIDSDVLSPISEYFLIMKNSQLQRGSLKRRAVHQLRFRMRCGSFYGADNWKEVSIQPCNGVKAIQIYAKFSEIRHLVLSICGVKRNPNLPKFWGTEVDDPWASNWTSPGHLMNQTHV